MKTLLINVRVILTIALGLFLTGQSADLFAQSPTNSRNYVMTQQPQVDGVKNAVDVNPLALGNKRALVTYMDGLGRKMQAINVASSPYFFDVIIPVDYDEFGREVKMYRPFTKVTNMGSFLSNALAEQSSFYSNQSKIKNTSVPYDQHVFEASPLNRVLEIGFSGENWKVQPNGNTVKQTTRTNVQGEVMFFNIQSGLPAFSGAGYDPGMLATETMTNENGITSEVFRDKNGRLVCSKTPLNTTEVAKTYFVYDDFGRIRFIIPPQAIREIELSGSGIITSAWINKWCFTYEYDDLGRVIEKRIPGQAPIEYVYNKVDQIVLLQDPKTRETNDWVFFKYDELGREVLKGLYNSTQSRIALQNTLDAANSQFEVPDGANFSIQHGYSNQTFPDVTSSSVEIQIVNYFDDYDFDNDFSSEVYYSTLFGFPGNTPAFSTKGLLTSSKKKVLGNNPHGTDWVQTSVFYDQKGRVIQQFESFIQGGGELVNFQYTFTGLVANETHWVFAPWLAGFDRFTFFSKRYTYDRGDRLVHTYFRINSEEEVRLSTQEYNEIGELIRKRLHGQRTSGNPGWGFGVKYLQNVDYKYNERGWLTHINDFTQTCEGGYSTLRVRQAIGRQLIEEFGQPEFDLIAQRIADDLGNTLPGTFPILESDEPLTSGVATPIDLQLDAMSNEIDESGVALFEVFGPESEGLGAEFYTLVQNLSTDPVFPSVQSFFDENLDLAAAEVTSEKLTIVLGNWFMDNLSPETSTALDNELSAYFSMAQNEPELLESYELPQELIDLLQVDFQMKANELMGDLEALEGLMDLFSEQAAQRVSYGFSGMQATVSIEPAVFESEVFNRLNSPEVQEENKNDVSGLLERIGLELEPGALGNILIGGIKGEVPITGGCKLELEEKDDLFAMRIEYDTDETGMGSIAQHNGNISATRWVHNESGSLKHRGYHYEYDEGNRLTKASYGQKTNSWANSFLDRFTVQDLNYDHNGNILGLTRKGAVDFDGTNYTFGSVDQLVYQYDGNQLQGVDDLIPDLNFTIGRSFDFSDRNWEILNNPSSLEYLYDDSGNMIEDAAKQMVLTYNQLNLPSIIEVFDNQGSQAGKIEFLYDLSGQKIQKTVFNAGGQVVSKRYYLNGIEFAATGVGQTATLDHIAHEEGRLVWDNNDVRLDYEIRDHLGNVRVSFSDQDGNRAIANTSTYSEVLHRLDFYPFGNKLQGTVESAIVGSESKYQYNGKELNDDGFQVGNFDWVYLDQYDYGARMYDPSIGRWGVVDPLGSNMPDWSPYAMAFNNPVKFIDENGEIPIIPWLLKAGANAAADMLAQATMSYLFDEDVDTWDEAYDKVNWYQVGRSGLEGLIPWKIPGGKIGEAAFTATGDVLVNALNDPDGYTMEQAGIDFATGFIGGLAGGGIEDLVGRYGHKAIAKGLMEKLDFSYADVAKLFGGGYRTINRKVNGITSHRMIKGWAEGKVAVIGRGMSDRVEVFAKGIGAETWKGWNKNLSDAQNLANNRRWIKKLKEEGYTIYDVGLHPKYKAKGDYSTGDYYGMEIEEVFGN